MPYFLSFSWSIICYLRLNGTWEWVIRASAGVFSSKTYVIAMVHGRHVWCLNRLKESRVDPSLSCGSWVLVSDMPRLYFLREQQSLELCTEKCPKYKLVTVIFPSTWYFNLPLIFVFVYHLLGDRYREGRTCIRSGVIYDKPRTGFIWWYCGCCKFVRYSSLDF